MGKATVVFYDDENGDTHVTCEYDPPLLKGQGVAGAQYIAYGLMEAMAGEPASTSLRRWSGIEEDE